MVTMIMTAMIMVVMIDDNDCVDKNDDDGE